MGTCDINMKSLSVNKTVVILWVLLHALANILALWCTAILEKLILRWQINPPFMEL
jgi:hypothetical protein